MYSVLMSVYAKEKPEYLRASIESVLAQSVKTDDFVIICDGPLTEELDEVLKEVSKGQEELFQIHRLSFNVGIGRALNVGIKLCKHDIVARMDSDDLAFPTRMEKEYALLTKENLDLVSATVVEFSESISELGRKRQLPVSQEEIRRFARRRNPFNHPAMMYKKSSVEKAGGYQDFYLFEDYYLWVRMLLAGMQGMNLEEPLLYMRTGTGMHQRRGGTRYAKSILQFRFWQLKSGFSSPLDFLLVAPGHMLVALLPNGMRKAFYENVLRK